jgi:hypothetical protein
MTRLWAEGESLQVETDSQGNPVRFVWRGRRHRLQRIQQRWQVDSDWWSAEGRVWRDYWAVVTFDGLLCVIYQNLQDRAWYMAKEYD